MSQIKNAKRLCVFLLQLGGPDNYTQIKPFLQNLFDDILPGPKFFKTKLASFIAAYRTPKVIPLYQAIGGGSPIGANTMAQALALEKHLKLLGFDARVLVTMRYSEPRASVALQEARKYWSDATWVVLPLYPHYAFATTRSSINELISQLATQELNRLKIIKAYPTINGFINSVTDNILKTLANIPNRLKDTTALIFSAHGIPLSYVRRGDPYPRQIKQSIKAISDKLSLPNPIYLCFQSRVGPVSWLKPSTRETIITLGKHGITSVLVIPISFVSEHLETLYELDIELQNLATDVGIKNFYRSPTPATHPNFIAALVELVSSVTKKISSAVHYQINVKALGTS
ncbi:MAG: ferrochelatase [Deltaproteobacteria bacterium]|nr:ferrochelatase [Deltaproteobacteria bacterium]